MTATKRLVVCIDGTWNNAEVETADTNVARIARAIRAHPQNDLPQSVLYLRGVGTAGIAIERAFAGAVGLGVDDLIRSAYMFLAQNYEDDDEIYVFGFSRGAFSARSLVGMIAACGLLRRADLGRMSEAWAYYRSPRPHRREDFLARTAAPCGDRAARASVRTRNVRIRMLGVWDTVGALGIPGSVFHSIDAAAYAFHDTSVCPVIDFAYHAMAVDEHREDFVPTLWTGDEPTGTKVLQTWFSGAHADVGGGYAERSLADVPLLWMADRAAELGLALDPECLPSRGDPGGAMHDSSVGAFAVNRVHPTWRQVCGLDTPVSFYETLYRPHDAKGRPLSPLNETIHSSVAARWGRKIVRIADRFPRSRRSLEYRPRNLTSAFDRSGAPLPGVVFVE